MFDEDELNVWEFIRPELFRSRNLAWGSIYIDLESGKVNFVQRWKYEFVVAQGVGAWTEQEKVDFHYAAESLIWKHWNSNRPLAGTSTDPTTLAIIQLLNSHNGVLFNVSGSHPFAQRFSASGVPIEFDVLVVITRPHWNVRVKKLAAGQFEHSTVTWDSRQIRLIKSAVETRSACNNAAPRVCSDQFTSVPHEFGHMLRRPDEYLRGSRFLDDANSIMNIGTEVRTRHLSWVRDQLNQMLPNCTFSLPPES
ncbi:MAG: hypothetical protein WBL40_05160 [Terrimicrobiaceae bacterium]